MARKKQEPRCGCQILHRDRHLGLCGRVVRARVSVSGLSAGVNVEVCRGHYDMLKKQYRNVFIILEHPLPKTGWRKPMRCGEYRVVSKRKDRLRVGK
jgi:hypothetical protein